MVRETERRDGLDRIVIINLVHVVDYEVQDVVTSSRGVD